MFRKKVKQGNRRGSAMLEYVLLGIPTLFLTISVMEVSLVMWQYHTLEQAAAAGARMVITHGANCSSACPVTVGNILTKITSTGIGLNATTLSVTLTGSSGTTYNPASSYLSSTTVFPSGADATVGNDITVTLSYPVNNPFAMFWPGAGGRMVQSSTTLQAVSRQRIIF